MNASALNYLFHEELYQFATPVVVVLPRAWDTYAAEDQLLLKKILTSVKVDINGVRMVIGPLIELNLLSIYRPARVLIFGGEQAEPREKYQQAAAQGFMVIRADDLNAMDDQKKKNLWTALRQMFGV